MGESAWDYRSIEFGKRRKFESVSAGWIEPLPNRFDESNFPITSHAVAAKRDDTAHSVLLRFGVGVFLLRKSSHVVHQIPRLFGFDARTLGGHVIVSILDDVENLAVGAVL